MKRLIPILLLLFTLWGNAQEKEHCRLFTDRDLYTSGETILFKLFLPGEAISDVIKINLINKEGKILAEARREIRNHQADGFLFLADSLQTGTYLLCTSTGEEAETTAKELFICNRFKGLTESSAISNAVSVVPLLENPADGLQIEGLKGAYAKRETANITFTLTPALLSQLNDPLFVAVSEKMPEFKAQSFLVKAQPGKKVKAGVGGIVLDGNATEVKTGMPFENGFIFLSIPDSVPWLDYDITGKDGYFSFHLKDHYGRIPVVIQGYDPGKKQLLKIRLNQSESLINYMPSFGTKDASEAFRKYASDAMETTMLRKIYNNRELAIQTPPSVRKHEYPFYGMATETVYPHLFIDLNDFTEISRELLPGVKFRANNRIPTLNILNPATLNYFSEQPLVVLDGVPVFDLNVIKNLGSKEIQRIEICRKERFYGDLIFAGVIAIYTKQPDYTRLRNSDDLIKLEMDALQPDVALNQDPGLKPNEPDLRKVLLWKPALQPGEKAALNFTTSDVQGKYKLTIRGKTKDGSIICKEETFEVK